MPGGIHVQTDDVDEFFSEPRVVREFELLRAMGLQAQKRRRESTTRGRPVIDTVEDGHSNGVPAMHKQFTESDRAVRHPSDAFSYTNPTLLPHCALHLNLEAAPISAASVRMLQWVATRGFSVVDRGGGIGLRPAT
jgi:hypothetical protein